MARNQNSNIFKIGFSEKASSLFIMQIVMLYGSNEQQISLTIKKFQVLSVLLNLSRFKDNAKILESPV